MAHVIIVDDQPSNRLLFSALARSIGSGITVSAFEDPTIALKACQAEDPDLIVTDFKMAGMTGAEFIRQLRALSGCDDVPVIVLTVYDERAFRMEALLAGATDFLLSPVDHAEFIARARNLLKMRSQQRLIENRAVTLAHELHQSELHREEIIRESGEALAQVIDTVPAFIMAADRESRCLFVNESQAHYAGGVPQDFVGAGVSKLVGPARSFKSNELDRQVFEYGTSIKSYEEGIEGPDGQSRTFLTTKTPLRDASLNVISVVTTSLDITSRKLAEERLTRMALHDALTDLPNRYLLDDLLQRLMQKGHHDTARFALLFLDLDRFKNVNDSFGHHAGDGLLQQIAQRLLQACRAGDTVARLGGDEFAILQTAMANEKDTSALAQRVIEAISQPLLHAGVSLRVTGSIGITMFPMDGTEAETLQRNADLAMYQAKAEGKNTFRFFQPAMNERVTTAIRMEADLRRALETNQFRLHYQPLLDLHAGRIIGFEALVRWDRPGHGLVMPNTFLPVAEETGLVAEMGAWVLRTAVRQAATWQGIDGRPIRIAVNVSPVQFVRQDVTQLVKEAVLENSLEPYLLDLELTEGTLLDDSPGTVEALRALSAFGMKFSIDDFGTGYASMNYIKRVPMSRLKIDRSFVQDFPASREDAAVVGSLVALGHALDVPILAEGVETMTQLNALRIAGCDEVQGFLIGRPVEADSVPDLIRRPAAAWKLGEFEGTRSAY
jgi:diguanylate cyclase (GGDEF)-like protein/PAS domain S-box-containing protein